MGDAKLRAAGLKDALEQFRSAHAQAYAQLPELVAVESWETVTRASRVTWIAARHEQEFLRAWKEVLGESGRMEFLRSMVRRTMTSPLFSAFFNGAKRVFGVTPTGLLKLMPNSLPLMYRDYMRVQIREVASDHCQLDFVDMHPEIYECTDYLDVWRALLETVLEVCEVDGEVTVEADPHIRRLRWQISWTPA